jgi:hypothetical protein
MEILSGYNPNLIRIKDRMLYALSPVTKNFESSSTRKHKTRVPRAIDQRDFGSLIHTAAGVVAESRFRTIHSVTNKLDPQPWQRETETGEVEVIYPQKTVYQSERWENAYGRNRTQVIERAASIGLQLVGAVQDTNPDQYLIPELRFMTSMKARAQSAHEVLRNPDRMREAIQDGQPTVVPHVVDLAKSKDGKQKTDIFGYTIQAIPDLFGVSAVSPEAQSTRRQLIRMIYHSNENNKRLMLDPKLLENNKTLLIDVMRHMLNGDMRISVTEIKTNSWTTKSLVNKTNDEIYEAYKHDVGHTLLVLMNVFKAVAPGAFRGREGVETILALLTSTDVHVGVVDFPALYSSWVRRIGHLVPKQPAARLITLTNEQVQKACTDRLKANIKYCLRHQTEDMCL